MNALTHRIVVGYDGSEPACQAVRWAAAEAARRDAELIVLHVLDGGVLVLGAAHDAVARSEGRRLAAAGAALAVAAAPGLRAVPQTRTGSVAARLIEAASDADLLVIGSHGHSPSVAGRLGTVAAMVAGHAPCPFVVVRGHHVHGPGPQRRVVVGTDGSPSSRPAVRFAADVAEAAHASLVIVSAWDPDALEQVMLTYGDTGSPLKAESASWRRRATQEALHQAEHDAHVQHPGLTVVTKIHRGEATWALIKAAHDAALLVVGTRGRGGLTSRLLGSVGHALIRSAPCPVAVVRADTDPPGSHRSTTDVRAAAPTT